MLHVIGKPYAGAENELLRRMFEARKKVFIDLLRWDLPVLAGRFELDQFDDEHAIYLMVADPTGEHLASARLLPTMRPHILGGLYAPLCEEGVPQGPDIFEVTRFCLDRRTDAATRRDARNQLVSALTDFALAQDITQYTAVAEIAWLQQILAFGWRCRPLGLPRLTEGRMLGALAIEIDNNTPDLLEQAGIYTSQVPTGLPRHAA